MLVRNRGVAAIEGLEGLEGLGLPCHQNSSVYHGCCSNVILLGRAELRLEICWCLKMAKKVEFEVGRGGRSKPAVV